MNMYEPIAKAGIPVLLIYGGADATVPHGLEIDERRKFVDFFNGGK